MRAGGAVGGQARVVIFIYVALEIQHRLFGRRVVTAGRLQVIQPAQLDQPPLQLGNLFFGRLAVVLHRRGRGGRRRLGRRGYGVAVIVLIIAVVVAAVLIKVVVAGQIFAALFVLPVGPAAVGGLDIVQYIGLGGGQRGKGRRDPFRIVRRRGAVHRGVQRAAAHIDHGDNHADDQDHDHAAHDEHLAGDLAPVELFFFPGGAALFGARLMRGRARPLRQIARAVFLKEHAPARALLGLRAAAQLFQPFFKGGAIGALAQRDCAVVLAPGQAARQIFADAQPGLGLGVPGRVHHALGVLAQRAPHHKPAARKQRAGRQVFPGHRGEGVFSAGGAYALLADRFKAVHTPLGIMVPFHQKASFEG